MKVGDLMAKHVEFIDPDASVQEAASMMGELDVSALPVGSAEDVKGVIELPAAVAPDEETARPAGPAAHDEPLVEIVAAKILIDWLRNRQQLLVPFTIDLTKLDPAQVELLVQAMIVAAQADGTV